MVLFIHPLVLLIVMVTLRTHDRVDCFYSTMHLFASFCVAFNCIIGFSDMQNLNFVSISRSSEFIIVYLSISRTFNLLFITCLPVFDCLTTILTFQPLHKPINNSSDIITFICFIVKCTHS
jgi:hypothetical protein